MKQGEHEQRYQLGDEVAVFEGRSSLGVDGLDQGAGVPSRPYHPDAAARSATLPSC